MLTPKTAITYEADDRKLVCRECGSDGVQLDAWAEWSNEKQDLVVADVSDHGHYCPACDVCDVRVVTQNEYNESQL